MDFQLSCVILALPLLATMASLAAAQSCVEDVCMGEMSYCKCQTGNDTMVDLSQVKLVEAKKHHSGLQHPDERIMFNPCHPFNEGDCKDSVVCMVKATLEILPAGQYKLASQNEAKFSKCGEHLVLKYEHLVRSKNMTTEITLICDETATKDSLKVTSEQEGKSWPNLPGDVKLELRSKSVCPKAFKPTTNVTPTTTVTPVHQNTTATLPQTNTTATLPHNITTATVPHSNTTATLPHNITTATVPHSNTTVTVPHSNTTVTEPHSNTTVTVPPSNTTVTEPHSNTTVTVPHSNTTVTEPHSNTTVTVPHSNSTVTEPHSDTTTPSNTTPENSAVSMSSTSSTVFFGITAIARYIL